MVSFDVLYIAFHPSSDTWRFRCGWVASELVFPHHLLHFQLSLSLRTAPQSRHVPCKSPGSAALCASAQCAAPLRPAGVFSSLDSGLLAALQPQSSDGVSEDHESAARVASFFSVWNDAHSSNTWQKPKHSHGAPSACGSPPLAQAPRRSGSGTLSFLAFPSSVSGSGHRPRGWRGASHRCAAPCPFSLTFKSSLLLPF